MGEPSRAQPRPTGAMETCPASSLRGGGSMVHPASLLHSSSESSCLVTAVPHDSALPFMMEMGLMVSPLVTALSFMVEMGMVTGPHVTALPFMVEMGVVTGAHVALRCPSCWRWGWWPAQHCDLAAGRMLECHSPESLPAALLLVLRQPASPVIKPSVLSQGGSLQDGCVGPAGACGTQTRVFWGLDMTETASLWVKGNDCFFKVCAIRSVGTKAVMAPVQTSA